MSTEPAVATARRTLVGPIVVAGEDATPTDGALRVAQLLARRDRVNAHVLTVVRPLALPSSLLSGVDQDAWQEVRRQQQLASVRQRLHETVGQTAHFSVGAESGSPAPTIARIARERGAELILVGIDGHGAHVAPDVDFSEMGKEGWGQIYDRGVASLLEQLAGELRIPGEVDVETVVVSGDPSTHLLEIAARGAFELVAAGSQTAPWVEWHLTGSVSTRLLRGARCAVLIAPPADPRG